MSKAATATSEAKRLESQLRETFRAMDPQQAQEIREAYYKAVEGLHTLAESLIEAGTEIKDDNGLIKEHCYAQTAIKGIENSLLGRIL